MLARQVSGRDAGKQERARSEKCRRVGLEQLGRATMASRKRTRQHHGLEMLELTCVVVAFATSGLVGTQPRLRVDVVAIRQRFITPRDLLEVVRVVAKVLEALQRALVGGEVPA